MSELEDRISSLLNDPEQMEQFAEFAKSVMGGGVPGLTGDKSASAPDSELLKKLGRIMSGEQGADSSSQALLEAMRPYLSEKRRGKIDKALKIAKLTKLASLAAAEFGGEEDV